MARRLRRRLRRRREQRRGLPASPSVRLEPPRRRIRPRRESILRRSDCVSARVRPAGTARVQRHRPRVRARVRRAAPRSCSSPAQPSSRHLVHKHNLLCLHLDNVAGAGDGLFGSHDAAVVKDGPAGSPGVAHGAHGGTRTGGVAKESLRRQAAGDRREDHPGIRLRPRRRHGRVYEPAGHARAGCART